MKRFLTAAVCAALASGCMVPGANAKASPSPKFDTREHNKEVTDE